jgi:hypothetical protein
MSDSTHWMPPRQTAKQVAPCTAETLTEDVTSATAPRRQLFAFAARQTHEESTQTDSIPVDTASLLAPLDLPSDVFYQGHPAYVIPTLEEYFLFRHSCRLFEATHQDRYLPTQPVAPLVHEEQRPGTTSRVPDLEDVDIISSTAALARSRGPALRVIWDPSRPMPPAPTQQGARPRFPRYYPPEEPAQTIQETAAQEERRMLDHWQTIHQQRVPRPASTNSRDRREVLQRQSDASPFTENWD